MVTYTSDVLLKKNEVSWNVIYPTKTRIGILHAWI